MKHLIILVTYLFFAQSYDSFSQTIDGAPGALMGYANIIKEGLVHGWNKVDLKPYNILTEGDFFVSIEFLPVRGIEVPNIYAGAVLIGGNRYSRKVSLGTWEKSQGGYALYITGEY